MSTNPSTLVSSVNADKLSAAARAFNVSSSNAPLVTRDRGEEIASTDVLVQLRSNLAQLDELHARLRFVMSEVSYLIKRD